MFGSWSISDLHDRSIMNKLYPYKIEIRYNFQNQNWSFNFLKDRTKNWIFDSIHLLELKPKPR